VRRRTAVSNQCTAYGTQPKKDSWMTIVGVVGNVRDAGVYRPGLNVLYAPFGQFDGPWKTVSLVLRTTVEPETLSQVVRRELAGVDRDAAVFLVKTMEQVVYDSTAGTRLLSRLLTIFSGLALVLAVALAARRALRVDPLATLRHE
jgi:hypothetical protein